MGKPENPDSFIRLTADDLTIYVAKEILGSLESGQSKLLVALSGYGRYWIYLE